jgi:ubiquinone/menaquinone biosynthesis C-methylase UbiE
MNENNRKALLQDTFDAVATGYDNTSLRFFPESAKYLASCLHLRGDEAVLDVATGTGHAAFALAAHLPQGQVTAVDFSQGMLRQAREKADRLNVRNISFLERDMRDLGFANGQFDAAICAFGIFFVEDMETQLAHIASKVKPSGTVAICNFQENYFSPMRDLMMRRLNAYGVQSTPHAWQRIANKAGCQELFAKAGLSNVRVEQKNMGYFLEHEQQWWDVIWNAGFRRLVNQLSLAEQERFRQEHLEEVAALAMPEGIWLNVGVLFSVGVSSPPSSRPTSVDETG